MKSLKRPLKMHREETKGKEMRNKSTGKSDSRGDFRVTSQLLEKLRCVHARLLSFFLLSLLNNVAELYQHNLEREAVGAHSRSRRYLADSRKIAERLAISSSPFDLSDRRSVCRRFSLSLVCVRFVHRAKDSRLFI